MHRLVIAAHGVELLSENVGDASDPAVLLIMGAMASGLWWPDELPNAVMLTLQGTGHQLHRDDWQVIIDAIERHTAGSPQRAASCGT